MTIEQSWTHATSEIPAGGLDRKLAASEEERAALAAKLDLTALELLAVSYRIIARAGGRFHLKGRLRARVVQECGITLDPVASEIDEALDLEFWPGELPAESAAGEHEALALHEIEPIERDRLNVGRIVFETLSAALDPYPRAQGADFQWQDEGEAAQARSDNPFAVLSRLKPKSD